MRHSSFEPLIDERVKPTILILGSLPGARSLAEQQYYAHPQNAFWWIMEKLFDIDSHESYAKRCRLLVERGIILWDVLQEAARKGSLDSNIEKHSVIVNRFGELFAAYPSIQHIAFNGQAAYKLFLKHALAQLPESLTSDNLIVMPSTSPAYAAITREQKLVIWSKLKELM